MKATWLEYQCNSKWQTKTRLIRSKQNKYTIEQFLSSTEFDGPSIKKVCAVWFWEDVCAKQLEWV